MLQHTVPASLFPQSATDASTQIKFSSLLIHWMGINSRVSDEEGPDSYRPYLRKAESITLSLGSAALRDGSFFPLVFHGDTEHMLENVAKGRKG